MVWHGKTTIVIALVIVTVIVIAPFSPLDLSNLLL